jgi:hypothetical protein
MRATTWTLIGALALAGCGGASSGSKPGTGGGGGGGDTGGSGGSPGQGGSPGTGGRGGSGGGGAPGTGGGGGGGGGAADAGPGSGGRPADGSAGAGGGPPAGDAGPVPMGVDNYGTLPNGGGIAESAKAFEDRLYDIVLTVAPADWDRLNKNAEAYDTNGIYIPAGVKIDGVDLGMIGIRYKGAYGTFRLCLQGYTGTVGGVVPATPIGGGCTNQLPIKLAFDEIDVNKRWNGLKKVNLHSLITDASKIREKLSFQLFRGMNIPTARSTHAKVTITVGAQSVVLFYAMTENIGDGRFIADHWPGDKEGNLYKQLWPRYLSATTWQNRLETNKDAMPAPTHDKAIAFSTEILNNKTNSEAILGIVQKWMDVKWMARYMAVDTVISNVDGVTKFWCRGAMPGVPIPTLPMNSCGNNNFYLYQTKSDKFLLIPWDLDNSWYVQPANYEIPMWDDKPSLTDCTKAYAWHGSDHLSPACDPILRSLNLAAPRAEYIQAIRDMTGPTGPLNVAKMQADVDRWMTYLRPGIMATRNGAVGGITINGALNVSSVDAGANAVKANVRTLRDRIVGVIDGMPFRR